VTVRPWVLVLAGVALLGVVAATALVSFLVPRDDPVSAPDAVVVLGGATPERAQLGIELHERFDVPLVVSSSSRRYAREQGYPCPPAICILTDPETTVGEAQATAALAETHGWERVTIVTTEFHTSRARMLFRQCLGDRVSVVGAELPGNRNTGRRRWVNEAVGVLAGSTVARAC
jgi:uncharacterized SAM-binding protein YcdF (DUF218 family)